MELANRDLPTDRSREPAKWTLPPAATTPIAARFPSPAPSRRGRLLIIRPKGLGRLESLYDELGNLGWSTTHAEVDDGLIRYLSRAAGIRPTLAGHRRAYLDAISRLARTPFAFVYRSLASGRILARLAGQVDCVLQIGGMWAPAWSSSNLPYTLFCDCTVRLGDGNPLSGVNFASRAAAERWYRRERALYRGAKAIFTASEYVRRSLIEDYGVPGERVTVVGYGINLKAPEDVHRSYDNQTMLFVGYEFERKGGPLLLEAFEKVRCQLPGAQLLVAGPRHAPKTLPAGVTWIGVVGREELARLYQRASLFVMPSLFEPFGLVYLEAMEWKLPCVGSAACAMPEIVLDRESGRLVKAGDVGELAAALTDLLPDPARLRRMGERGRRHARERFPWPMVAGRVDEGLRRVLLEVAPQARTRVAE